VGYRVLAGAVVAVHFAFLAFVIAGGFIALRWRWTIWAHLAACTWAAAIVAVPGLDCPLTAAQIWALRQAGATPYTGGFVNEYVENVIYPARYTTIVQVFVAFAVAGSWLLFYLKRRVATVPQT
jgi:hypothetical protein